jgi:hypothetical protein
MSRIIFFHVLSKSRIIFFHVLSKSESRIIFIGYTQSQKIGKPKDRNRTTKINQGHHCPRKDNLNSNNNYIIRCVLTF